jgi:hypothetical protein
MTEIKIAYRVIVQKPEGKRKPKPKGIASEIELLGVDKSYRDSGGLT